MLPKTIIGAHGMAGLRYIASDHVRSLHALYLPPREIANYRFLYVESGEGDFSIAGESLQVASGWLGLLSPGRRANRYSEAAPVSYLFVEFASTVSLSDAFSVECRLGDPQRTALIALLQSIDQQRSDRDGCLLAAAVRLLLAEEDAAAGPRMDQRLTQVVRMIQSHPNRNPTITDLAAEAGLSEPHLRRLFHQHLQTSPKRYLLRARMEFAQRLLRYEGLSVGEVARVLEISSVYQFSAQYRKVLGHPPSSDRSTGREPG